MSGPEKNILHDADRVTQGARNEDYGSPLANHSLTAALWTSYLRRAHDLNVVLTPEDVCILNILQKVSRAANTVTRDTLIDIAGYARNVEMVWDEQAERELPVDRETPGGLERLGAEWDEQGKRYVWIDGHRMYLKGEFDR